MEAVIVALRPKQQVTLTHDFQPKAFDILLTDLQLSGSDRRFKQLPKAVISFEDEPTDTLLTFLYQVTGAEHGGLHGKRAIFIPASRGEPSQEVNDSFVKGTLYCIPIKPKGKLSIKYAEKAAHRPAFYGLELVLDTLNKAAGSYTKQTCNMLRRLESWLKEKYKVPGAVDLLFSSAIEDRLRLSVTNPAYFDQSQSLHGSQEQYTRTNANEALAKMMSIEKCDITIINPVYGSGLPYINQVEAFAVNRFWSLGKFGKPDYKKIALPPGQRSSNMPESIWTEEFLVHKFAYEGDAKKILELIRKGYVAAEWDNDGWAPIHYATWNGHLDAVKVLLWEGDCPPNLPNRNHPCSTPLHFAASNKHIDVVELLLSHPHIDVNVLNKNNKTALDMCEDHDTEEVAILLKEAMDRPYSTIQVHLMDGTFRMLNAVSGANTTVKQLHGQMMEELDLPDELGHLFTIWICSHNLQLQLKHDLKPIDQLNVWERKIIGQLTDVDPLHEDPQLFWRRDAILSLREEQKVENQTCISLLFHEAYRNYIQSFYPCANRDIFDLGSVLMQLHHGDYEPRKTRNFFSSENALVKYVPVSKLKIRSIEWAREIQHHYSIYSRSMANKDRSPSVLQLDFLRKCWNLVVYGSTFFTGYVQIRSSKSLTKVYIGVNDIGIHIINSKDKVYLRSFPYTDIRWTHKPPDLLEIWLKNVTSEGGMWVKTKQAGLINRLMGKLSTMNNPAGSAEGGH